MTVTVRQATLEDRPEIFDFIRRAYAGRWEYKIPERWEWEFVHNPYIKEGELPIWIAVDGGGKVVGQTCALIEPLKLGQETHRVGWSVDTYLDPDYRGQGIGYALQQANDQANEIFMSLSMSEANRRIKAALGSVAIEPVATFVRTVRHTPAGAKSELASRLGRQSGALSRLLTGLLRGLHLDRFLANGLNRRRDRMDARLMAAIDPGVAITPVEAFDAGAGALWEKASPHFHAIVQRDQVYLNWKFVRQPHVQYLRLLAHRQGTLCGYLVLRKGQPPEPEIGILADLFVPPDDQAAIRALLAWAVHYFKGEAVESIHAATTVSAYQGALAAFGFRQTGSVTPMLHCRVGGADCQRALQPGSWFLGRADHDWDQVPLAGNERHR